MSRVKIQRVATVLLGILGLGPAVAMASARDLDNDGWPNFIDCRQLDPTCYPGATELCDGKDNDCDGQVDENVCGSTSPVVDITSPASGGVIAVDGGQVAANVTFSSGAASLFYSLTSSAGSVTNPSVSFPTTSTAVLTADLPACGSQTLTLTATSSGGKSGTDTVNVVADDEPIVAITSPSDGWTIAEGYSLSVAGSVVEGPCGEDPAVHEVSWEVDGVEEFSGFPQADGTTTYTLAGLTPGDHLITLRAYDAAGLSGEDTIVVTVTADVSCDIDSDTVALYEMERYDGLTLQDTSGLGNDMTVIGGPVQVANDFNPSMGNVLQLDGVDDYASAPDAASLDATSEVTVLAWIKLDTLPPLTTYAPNKNWSLILSKGDALAYATDRNYSFYVQHNVGESLGRLHFSLSWPSGTGTTNPTFSNAVLTTAEWIHVAGRASPGSGGTVEYFVNGALDQRWTGRGNTALLPNNQPLYIGKAPQQADPYLDGALEDVRVYTCALTDAEIQLIYDSTAN